MRHCRAVRLVRLCCVHGAEGWLVLNIELTSLRPQELQRLLEVARARHQVEFEAELLAELTRRSGGGEVHAQPQIRRADAPRPAKRRRGPAALAAMAATVLVAGGIGWGVAPEVLSAFSQPSRPTAAPPQRTLLAYEPPQPQQAAPAASIAEAANLTAKAADDETPTASPPPQRLAMALTATPSRAAATPSPSAAAHKPANPCLSLPTPGERLVCGYPSLAIQDRQLQQAYDRAVSAGADPREIESAKAQWRQARDRVWDREQLADLYAQRLREVEGNAPAKAESAPL